MDMRNEYHLNVALFRRTACFSNRIRARIWPRGRDGILQIPFFILEVNVRPIG